MTPLDYKKYFSSDEFKSKYLYDKDDLGITYSKDKTVFKIWAPTAQSVILNLYNTGSDKEENARVLGQFYMNKCDKGVWIKEIHEDLKNVYYDYEIEVDGEVNRSADIYAVSCGINGRRSMVINLNDTNPEGFKNDTFGVKNYDSPIIYELHIKDFSYDKNSGISEEHRGKYLAFREEGTTLNDDGIHKTGICYLKNLGVTHVQLMPCFDYASVDESGDDGQFNWGYDPLNYNVPEGSYATDPYDGNVRIKEFKEMILALHKAGIRVVMDVVYNHTYSLDSWFQKTVPYYYYRQNEDGTFCDGSACGNDTASERYMFGEYIKKSVLYWTKEYHIDGFRFDLMGLHNIKLMNDIRHELNKLPNGKNVLMYGEPWRARESNMEGGEVSALKKNIEYLDEGVGIFCDDTRDAIKGHVFYGEVPGFVNGGINFEKKIKSSIVGFCDKSEEYKPKSPGHIISYVSAHDNLTLYDKLIETMREDKDYLKRDEELITVNKLTAVIVFTCMGNIFFQAGEEFARTKKGENNSYNLLPELNMLDWKRAYEYKDLQEYYIGLIELRKKLSGFYSNEAGSEQNINFIQCVTSGVVEYTLKNTNDIYCKWSEIYVIYNSSVNNINIKPPYDAVWQLLLNKYNSSIFKSSIMCSNILEVPAKSAVILGKVKV